MKQVHLFTVLALLVCSAWRVTIAQTAQGTTETVKGKKKTEQAKLHQDHQKHETQSKIVSKDSLIAEGKYNCCLKGPCDECYRGHQSCNCYEAVKKDKAVCQECYNGWQKGLGRLDWIDKSKVKVTKSHKH